MSARSLAALALQADDPLFDVVRLLLISQAGFTLGMIALVVVSLWAGARRRLLPAHVFLISTSHAMLILYAAFDVYTRLGDTDPSWRTPLLVAAFLVSDLALVLLLTYQRRRLRAMGGDHPRRRADDL